MSEYFPEKLKTRPLISADKVLSLRCEKDQDIKVLSKYMSALLTNESCNKLEITFMSWSFSHRSERTLSAEIKGLVFNFLGKYSDIFHSANLRILAPHLFNFSSRFVYPLSR